MSSFWQCRYSKLYIFCRSPNEYNDTMMPFTMNDFFKGMLGYSSMHIGDLWDPTDPWVIHAMPCFHPTKNSETACLNTFSSTKNHSNTVSEQKTVHQRKPTAWELLSGKTDAYWRIQIPLNSLLLIAKSRNQKNCSSQRLPSSVNDSSVTRRSDEGCQRKLLQRSSMRKSACLLQRLWKKHIFNGRINKIGESILETIYICLIVSLHFFPRILIYKSTWIFLVFLNGRLQLAFRGKPSIHGSNPICSPEIHLQTRVFNACLFKGISSLNGVLCPTCPTV